MGGVYSDQKNGIPVRLRGGERGRGRSDPHPSLTQNHELLLQQNWQKMHHLCRERLEEGEREREVILTE